VDTKKITLYSEIIEHIAYLRTDYNNWSIWLNEHRETDYESNKEYLDKLKNSHISLNLLIMQSSILINQSLILIIKDIMHSVDKLENHITDQMLIASSDPYLWEMIPDILKKCEEGQEQIQKIAKNELLI